MTPIGLENTALYIKEIQQSLKNLRDADQQKNDFIVAMSHELRTPLTSIIGFAELILEKDKQQPLPAEFQSYREYLRLIADGGHYLLRLLSNILDLAKIDAGKLLLSKKPVDLNELLSATARMVSHQAAAQRIELISELPPHLWVEADSGRLQEVVLNLLSNALKFTPSCGKVGIRCVALDGYARIEVWDTGVGIAPENVEVIFQPFRQCGPPVNEQPGSGIGLTLVRRLVRLHGGQIWVDSSPDRGSCFNVTIPLST